MLCERMRQRENASIFPIPSVSHHNHPHRLMIENNCTHSTTMMLAHINGGYPFLLIFSASQRLVMGRKQFGTTLRKEKNDQGVQRGFFASSSQIIKIIFCFMHHYLCIYILLIEPYTFTGLHKPSITPVLDFVLS